MCGPQALAFLGMGGAGAAGAATAAGATAAAGTVAAGTIGSSLGLILQAAGTVMSVAGNLRAGREAQRAANEQAVVIAAQQQAEKQLNSVKDSRARGQMESAIAQQRAEIAARGIQLDSPTALLLGETAAQELSFESQSIRATGAARDAELGAEARLVRLRGAQNALTGRLSAVDSLLRAPPALWKGFTRNSAGATA